MALIYKNKHWNDKIVPLVKCSSMRILNDTEPLESKSSEI